MPVYVLRCDRCETQVEEYVPHVDQVPNCACGHARSKVPTLFTGVVAPWLRDENFEGRAAQRQYMETPEVQKKLKTGEYEIRAGRDSGY